jgi:hypothetical protein
MSAPPPLPCRWDGEAFAPLPRFARIADKHLVVGEEYRLAVVEERSQKAHNHFFAALTEAWNNLREEYAERFQSVEALRKYLLIKAGFCDQHTLVCSSHAEAMRVASFIRPADEFAVVVVQGNTVVRYVAQSQSKAAMGADRFKASKTAVLDLAADMVGVAPATLEREAGRAA